MSAQAVQMSKLRVHSFSISLDGYGAGPDQDLDNPLGRGGLMLHEWRSGTRTFQQLFGSGGGATGVDDDVEARGLENIGAWLLLVVLSSALPAPLAPCTREHRIDERKQQSADQAGAQENRMAPSPSSNRATVETIPMLDYLVIDRDPQLSLITVPVMMLA
jgi:hypothetical protein